jgi:hypothetical protein
VSRLECRSTESLSGSTRLRSDCRYAAERRITATVDRTPDCRSWRGECASLAREGAILHANGWEGDKKQARMCLKLIGLSLPQRPRVLPLSLLLRSAPPRPHVVWDRYDAGPRAAVARSIPRGNRDDVLPAVLIVAAPGRFEPNRERVAAVRGHSDGSNRLRLSILIVRRVRGGACIHAGVRVRDRPGNQYRAHPAVRRP